MTIDLTVTRYETLNECLTKFFGCDINEAENIEGTWEWVDVDGTCHKGTMQESINSIRENYLVWAWLNNNTEIHIWIGEMADPVDIIGTLAHEIGHAYRPHHRCDFKDEQKANKYEEVTAVAFNIMNDLMKGENDGEVD